MGGVLNKGGWKRDSLKGDRVKRERFKNKNKREAKLSIYVLLCRIYKVNLRKPNLSIRI